MQTALDAEIAAKTMTGAAVCIDRAGEPFDVALGVDGEGSAFNGATNIWMSSLTKPVTCAAALVLVDRGLLSLDAPVETYLPAFARRQVAPPEGLVPAERSPTIRDLMRHTAGFIYGEFGTTPLHQQYREARLMDPAISSAQFIERLAGLPLAYQPGTTFEYSPGIDLLGCVIAAISGMSLSAFAEREFFKPLRLTSFNFGSDPNAFQSGGGGLHGTLSEYNRLLGALLFGGSLISKGAIAEMTRNQLPADTVFPKGQRDLFGPLLPSPDQGCGYGFGVAVKTDPKLGMPGALGDVSWIGASGCYFWAYPAQKLVVAAAFAGADTPTLVRMCAVLRQQVYG
ncbi:hypothetical protein ABAC460_18090 [Asticcacaulis sp. AC460]|nr:hypothetical protein ABAC460_18090 [Asticcacaulis sp. AC460]